MSAFVGVDGVCRQVSGIEIGYASLALHVLSGYCGVNGSMRSFLDVVDQIQRIEFRATTLYKRLLASDTSEEISASESSSYGSYSINSSRIRVSASNRGYGLSIGCKDVIVFQDGHEISYLLSNLCDNGHSFSLSLDGTLSVSWVGSSYVEGTYMLWCYGTELYSGHFETSTSFSKTITSIADEGKWALEVGAGLQSGSGTHYTTLNLPSAMTIDNVSIPCEFVDAL